MKRLKSLITGAAMIATFAAGATMAQAESPLRLGTEGAFPPFNYFDESGKLVGFDVEIGQALCDRMGRKCDLVAQDWDGIIPGLLANKYDFIIASMFITNERKKKVSFSEPYYLAAMTHVAAKDSGITKNDLHNKLLKGKIIGAQSGTTQADFAAKVYPDAELRLYPTQDEVNLDMASGRIDMMVGDMVPLWEWVSKTNDGSCCDLVGEPITDPQFVGDGVGIAIRKEDEGLRMALNKALAEILADGTYKKINDKYFDLNLYTMKPE